MRSPWLGVAERPEMEVKLDKAERFVARVIVGVFMAWLALIVAACATGIYLILGLFQ